MRGFGNAPTWMFHLILLETSTLLHHSEWKLGSPYRGFGRRRCSQPLRDQSGSTATELMRACAIYLLFEGFSIAATRRFEASASTFLTRSRSSSN
jgi:hypothetical protein